MNIDGREFRSEFYELMKDKIGNCLIYFCKEADVPLSTALKLLYFTDETSVKKSGVPITWLEYNACKRGPVACDVYFEANRLAKTNVKDVNLTLNDYINCFTIEEEDTSHVRISAKKPFDDSEFSDYEIKILEEVKKKYGHMSSNKLSSLSHRKGGLWDKVCEANNLDQYFKIKNTQYSPYPVEFIPLIDNRAKELAYSSAYENLSYQKTF
ncbi:MAG: hypothetical protein JWO09_2072 [Bacteroidetes bacterium]|nr:hypothetical protein [Bacteroidota bacterium]